MPDSTKTPSGTTSEGQGQSPGGSGDESQNSTSKKAGAGSTPIEEITVEAAGTEGGSETPQKTPEFRNPLLKGKSPEEIDRLFAAQQEELTRQNTELNRLHTRSGEHQPSAPAPKRELPEYEDNFMKGPMSVLEKRLTAHLDEMVTPIREEVRAGKTESTRDKLKKSLKHFGRLEPHIDGLVRQNGGDPAKISEADLTNMYYTVVGIAQERGINLNVASEGEGTTRTETREEPRMDIPQNRPSAAPLPKKPTESQRRTLTDDEMTLARQNWPELTPDKAAVEYIKLQDALEDEIVTPGFSKKNW